MKQVRPWAKDNLVALARLKEKGLLIDQLSSRKYGRDAASSSSKGLAVDTRFKWGDVDYEDQGHAFLKIHPWIKSLQELLTRQC